MSEQETSGHEQDCPFVLLGYPFECTCEADDEKHEHVLENGKCACGALDPDLR
jgi:hypothetical protein